jgi:Mannose-6-phosphate isomerase
VATEVRRVEKPWGYELIWAVTDVYVGKVLFVKAGHSLSLQFHHEKDEAWYVQSGRARLELGHAGEGVLTEEVVTAGAAFHYAPGTVHRVTRSRTRRSSRSRRRSSTTSSGSRTRTGARAPRRPRANLHTVLVRLAAWSR